MYGAVIMAALVVTYRQIWPVNPQQQEAQTEKPAKTEILTEATSATAAREAETAEKEKRKQQVEKLLVRQNTLKKQVDKLTVSLDRDKKRLFHRIPQDSLAVYDAKREALRREIQAINVELGRLGYDPLDDGAFNRGLGFARPQWSASVSPGHRASASLDYRGVLRFRPVTVVSASLDHRGVLRFCSV